jgi:hypothetical protein
MPKGGLMEQISRPFQIALIAVIGLSMAWFVALRHHGASSTATPVATTATPAPAPSGATEAQQAAKPTHVYHGAATGVEGLTRAVRKAHEAVGTSQKNEATLERKSAEASSESPAQKTSTPGTSTAPTSASATTPKASSHTTKTSSAATKRHSVSSNSSAAEVKHEIAQGKTVLLLFWNPKSIDDTAVHKQIGLAQHTLGKKVVVHDASAKQIGIFGQVTQDITVYQTPTILIINRKKLVTTLTGFTDAFSIAQAVREAEK